MSEMVDATLILIPSAQAISHTLLTFLHTDAKPFLARTIFVLTDNVDAPTRESVRAAATARVGRLE